MNQYAALDSLEQTAICVVDVDCRSSALTRGMRVRRSV